MLRASLGGIIRALYVTWHMTWSGFVRKAAGPSPLHTHAGRQGLAWVDMAIAGPCLRLVEGSPPSAGAAEGGIWAAIWELRTARGEHGEPACAI